MLSIDAQGISAEGSKDAKVKMIGSAVTLLVRCG